MPVVKMSSGYLGWYENVHVSCGRVMELVSEGRDDALM
jgi:hypothetical protein